MDVKLRAMAPGATPVRPVSLQDILQNVVTLQRSRVHSPEVNISLKVDDSLPLVAGDRDRLVQLFTNLVQNAVEASPQGGSIYVTASTSGSTVSIEVVDNGLGLTPEIQERLFEPFLTTKSSGMGLGLSICREIADAHKARLTLENREDHPGVRAAVLFTILSSAEVVTVP
jgi:signal transduction histidine kinase